MKKPEEYLRKVNTFTIRKDLYKIGRQIQVDAYNKALEDVIEIYHNEYTGVNNMMIKKFKKLFK